MLRKYVEMATSLGADADAQSKGALLAVYLFLLVTSTAIGKAVRDALFLNRFTAVQMTYADLQTVIAIGIAMAIYFRLHRSMTLRRLLISSSVFFALGDVACCWAATFHQAWLTRAIYYWVGTQAAVTLPQVSMLAREVLTTRQAKRVFGVIGTGAIFGWIIGGLVTRAAAGRIGSEGLLLVMAGLTAVSPALVARIWPAAGSGPLDNHGDDRPLPAQGLLRSAALVWSSPHLRTVACLVFLSSVVTTIAGLQFKAIASQSIAGTDRLTAFLGSFTFHAGLASLAVQILCTSRILRYFGVGIGLVVAPLALATCSVGVLAWGTLSSAVFLKGSDHVLRHSIDRAALELLYVPLSPDETFQAKTFIDAVVYRVGDAVGALAVVLGATLLHLSFPALSVISLGFLAAWIAVAVQARYGYVERLLATLRQRTAVPAEAAIVPAESSETGRALVESLFDPDQAARLEILRALNAFQACHPGLGDESGPLVTALAAEVVGLYRLLETSMPTQTDVSATRDYQEAIERICRLLKLISPEHDPVSAFVALQSGDARLRANGLEYLENILKPPYRRLLVPLLEPELRRPRAMPARQATADDSTTARSGSRLRTSLSRL